MPYASVLALSRRGIVRPAFSMTITLRLCGTPETLVYVVALVPVMVLVDIRALQGIVLIFGLVAIGLVKPMIDTDDRSRGVQWPQDLA